MEKTMYEQIVESLEWIRERSDFNSGIGLVLGSGISGLMDEMQVEIEFPYADIPNFPTSSVKGHKGRLIFGRIFDTPVILMAGRFHYYEGYSMKEVTFPIRLMHFLGVRQLMLTNASGGLKAGMAVGDITFITDQIYLQPDNPLRGPNDDRLGPRFPDMSEPYDKALLELARRTAAAGNIPYHEGVYASVPGPNYETPAEYTMFHRLGADAVGMSTGSEVLVARHMDMKVFCISVIADIGYPVEAIQELNHDMVVAEAAKALPNIRALLQGMLPQMDH